MKKNVKFALVLASASFCALNLFAYNPPAGGENLFGITGPSLFTTASSAAGGAFFEAGPSSVAFNPALPAFEQQNILEAGFTGLHCSDDPDDKSFGAAFSAGLSVPTKWGVGTGQLFGGNLPFYESQLGKFAGIKYVASRDVSEKLAAGIGFSAGYLWGYDKDFLAAADLGFMYWFGTAGVFKDLRFGASLLNLGKTFTDAEVLGIKGKKADSYPGIGTLRTGFAGTFYESENLSAAFSADIAVPAVQNFIFDTGIQVKVMDFMTLSSSWEYNAQEYKEDCENLMPSFGISFKFLLNSKDSSFMKENGWQQSELTVSSAYKKMYDHINAVSGGVKLELGLKDTEAPEIQLFGNE